MAMVLIEVPIHKYLSEPQNYNPGTKVLVRLRLPMQTQLRHACNNGVEAAITLAFVF